MKNTFVRFGLVLCGMLLHVAANADMNTTCSATMSSPKAAQISKSTTNASTAILIDMLSTTPVTIGTWELGYGAVPKATMFTKVLTTCTKNGTAITAATTAVIGDVISCPIAAVGGTGIEVALFDNVGGAAGGTGIIDIHQFVTACTAGKGTYWKPPTAGVCAASLQASACITQSLLPPVLGMAAGSTSAVVNSNVTFTLSVSNPNTATALSNVVVSDVIPTNMTYISSAPTLGTVTRAGQTLTWIIPSLPAGGGAQLTLVVQPTVKGTYTNTATSSGATPASATILILPSAITRYSMDEAVGAWTGATGEVIDSGGNSLNGYRRAVAATTTNTFAPGPAPAPAPTIASQYPSVKNGFCNAGKFDGNAVVESASSTFFNFTNTLSASVWVYPTAYPAAGGLYSILSNDTNYEFHLNSAGRLNWWWGGGARELTSAATIPLNRWTHIAITMDSSLGASSRQRIYINGVADATTNNWSGNLTKNNCPFYIGGDISTNSGCALMPERNFRGMIDEAKVYDYELTAAEVQADMTLGRTCTTSSAFDHIRIEHDGSASACASKTVTVKACADAACTSLYTGAVTLTLSPTGWTPADTVTINGGVTTVTLSQASIAAPSITLNATGISPAPAGITRCFNGATETCTLSVAATSCRYDAAEVGAVYPQTHLYTKLAGTPFTVNILALTGTAPNLSVDTGYNRTVVVDLVDTSTAPCDGASPALSAAQNVAFTAADKGYKAVTMTCATPATSVQVRITRNNNTACSTDKFAVRPSAVTLTSTNAQATPPSPTDAKTIVAGAPFNLGATTTPTGYTGTLSQDKAKLTAQLPTNVAGVVTGGGVGALETSAVPKSPLALTANATPTSNATYTEVGYLYVNPGAFSDAVFTSVDQVGQVTNCATTVPESCDCLLSSNMTNAGVPDNLSDVLINGRYGCYVGNKTRFDLGRFIPDHFDTAVYQVAGVPMNCPTGLTCPTAYNGLVYSGQAFPVQVTAANQAGGTTLNYTGNFAKAITLQAWNAMGGTATQNPSGALANGSITAASFAAGVSTAGAPTYTLSTVTTAPVNVYIRAIDADGVTSLRASNPATTSVEGGVAVASGRIKVSNEYGSELLPLTLTAQAQYYSANGWVASITDNVTKLALTYGGTLTTSATVTPATNVLSGGSLSIKLAAPKAAGTVTVTPSISATSPGNPPLTLIQGTATFGIYKTNNTFIYRRER